MKKTYMQPTLQVVQIESATMLCASTTMSVYGESDGTVDAGSELKGGRSRAWRDYEGR